MKIIPLPKTAKTLTSLSVVSLGELQPQDCPKGIFRSTRDLCAFCSCVCVEWHPLGILKSTQSLATFLEVSLDSGKEGLVSLSLLIMFLKYSKYHTIIARCEHRTVRLFVRSFVRSFFRVAHRMLSYTYTVSICAFPPVSHFPDVCRGVFKFPFPEFHLCVLDGRTTAAHPPPRGFEDLLTIRLHG